VEDWQQRGRNLQDWSFLWRRMPSAIVIIRTKLYAQVDDREGRQAVEDGHRNYFEVVVP
jgi:hypothetical protein